MTFSIVARCAASGRFGVAVSSSSPAVAARCAFARAGVGAVASQNITDPALGPRCLQLIALGVPAPQALATIVDSTEHIQYRQLSAVDGRGRGGFFSGAHTLGRHAGARDVDVVCAGNLLADEAVPEAMVDAFRRSAGEHLGDRLLAAMTAGLAAGGEAGPVHSAGLLLVDKTPWPVADLRVDWHQAGDPIGELRQLWQRYRPQLDDYLTRALNPAAAPGYGVPGED